MGHTRVKDAGKGAFAPLGALVENVRALESGQCQRPCVEALHSFRPWTTGGGGWVSRETGDTHREIPGC